MNDEEERPKQGRFRVVDKRISSRADDPAPRSAATTPAERTEIRPPASGPEGSRDPLGTDRAPTSPLSGPSGAPEEPIWTPEQEAEAQRFLQEIAQRPSLEWVVNAAVTLANVAGTKLDLGQTADAQLAIDALVGVVEKLGSRLGQAEAPLRQTLAQLQLAYANRATAPPPPTTP